MKTTAIAILLIAGGLTNIQAEPTPGPVRLTWFLKLFDADENGVLDAEERQAAKEYLKQKREEVIAKWDADGDGKLNRAEIAALRKHIRERIHERRYEKFLEIAGEDKLMSAEEFATIPALADMDPEKVTALFERLDRDDDGSLTFAEFKRKFHRHR